MAGKRIGIVWEGSFFVYHSLALVNREMVLHLLDEPDLDIGLIPYEPHQFDETADPRFPRLAERFGYRPDRVDCHVRMMWPPRFDRTEGRFILYQPWEYGAIPSQWLVNIERNVDEVWAMSDYVRQSYIQSGVDPGRVFLVPHGVNPSVFKPSAPTAPPLSTRGFRFLFVGGTIYRKGIDLLLQAYISEFRPAEDVTLIVKDFEPNSIYRDQTYHELIRKIQSNHTMPELIHFDQTMDEGAMARLYRSCHCLVQPYRAEGYGLPIAEAMACGLPAIVTGYGACLDFCTPETAIHVAAEVKQLPQRAIAELGTVAHPQVAEADVADLRQKMRYAFEHPQEMAAGRLRRLAGENTRGRIHATPPALQAHGPGLDVNAAFHRVAHTFEANPALVRSLQTRFREWFHGCDRVLDIGCGRGIFLELLKEIGVHGVGVDLDPKVVAEAREKGLEAHVADALEFMAARPGGFDGIFMGHIIEHFVPRDALDLLLHCRQALKPGGILIVQTPNFAHPDVQRRNFWLDLTHVRPYPLELLEAMLAALDLRVLEARVMAEVMDLDAVVVGRVEI